MLILCHHSTTETSHSSDMSSAPLKESVWSLPSLEVLGIAHLAAEMRLLGLSVSATAFSGPSSRAFKGTRPSMRMGLGAASEREIDKVSPRGS